MVKKTKIISEVVNVEKKTPKSAKAENVISIPQPIYRISTNMRVYRSAVQMAESIQNPNRTQLYEVYQQTMLDPQVTACIQQAKDLVMSCEFCVYNQDGTENEEKTKIIKTKWFNDFVDEVLNTPYWGHSLIQFEDIIERNGISEFKEVELVPRQYVKPEYHRVVTTQSGGEKDGIDYLELPFSKWCIGVGKKRDLGLLLKISPLVIWKKNAMGAWAEYVEKFGSPIRIGKTEASDEASVSKMEGMLRNMSVASWGIFNLGDEIDIKGDTRQDAYKVYDMMIERCNSEIAKIVLGQTMTTDNGSSKSQAEVHERMLDMVGYRLKRFIYSVINNQLIPVMNDLGFGLEGCYIDIESEDEFTLTERSKFDIELLKTGKFSFTPEYIKENYGSEVIEVKEPKDTGTSPQKIKNLLNEYYG